jgi:hypothetical protein
MFKCFTKRSSVINSIYSGQLQFSYMTVVMPSVALLNAVVLSVMAPDSTCLRNVIRHNDIQRKDI